MDGCRAALGEADRLYAPAVTGLEREQAVLRQRTARAEAAVAEQALSGIGKEALARLSGDLARTQAEHAGAIATASRLAVRTELANGLSPALDTLRDGMAGLSASVTAIARDMMPGLARLRSGVDAAGSALQQAIAGGVRRLPARQSAPRGGLH